MASDLVSGQAYNVALVVRLPRTPDNVAQGNFMLDLSLGRAAAAGRSSGANGSAPHPGVPVVRSSRPAALTYYSAAVDGVNRAVALPLLVAGLAHEAETLVVPMFEQLAFARGAVPDVAWLQLRSTMRKMVVYSVHVEFGARLSGLRYVFWPQLTLRGVANV